MARSKSNSNSGQRGYLNEPLARLLYNPIKPLPFIDPLPQPTYTEVLPYAGDRRLFNPSETTEPVKGVTRASGRVVAGNNFAQYAFEKPKLVGICARRAIRREVLHALKRVKRGSGSAKHYNFWSKVSCK